MNRDERLSWEKMIFCSVRTGWNEEKGNEQQCS